MGWNGCKGHPVSISWWEHMHVEDARWLDLTIIQVSRPHATNSERDPRISWFVYQGQDPQEGLAQIALLYGLRFCQEHGYRFDKQALLWTEPRLRVVSLLTADGKIEEKSVEKGDHPPWKKCK